MHGSSSAGKKECFNTFKLVSTVQFPGNFCPLISQLWIKIFACECIQAVHMSMLSRYQSYDNLYIYYTVVGY
jgi:hypothetical protein